MKGGRDATERDATNINYFKTKSTYPENVVKSNSLGDVARKGEVVETYGLTSVKPYIEEKINTTFPNTLLLINEQEITPLNIYNGTPEGVLSDVHRCKKKGKNNTSFSLGDVAVGEVLAQQGTYGELASTELVKPYVKENILYEIPILINDFDLQFLKMDKEIFDKIIGKIKISEKIKDSFTDIEWNKLYQQYIFIINNPNDYMLIINIFLLLQANSEKSYFQRQDFHVKYKEKVLKQTGGGIFDNIKKGFTDIKGLFNYDYQLASGFSQYIEGGFNTITIFTSIEAINYFLKTQLSNTTILAMTILIETIGVRNLLSSLKPIAKVGQTAVESRLPLQVARRMNNVISFASINSETLDEYFKKSKKQVLKNVSENVRQQIAIYNSSKYSDPMTQIVSISYNAIKEDIKKFQTDFKILTEEFMKIINIEIESPIEDPNIDINNTIIIYNQKNGTLTFTEDFFAAVNNFNKGQMNIIKQKIRQINPTTIHENCTRGKLFTIANTLPIGKDNPKESKKEHKKINCPVCDQKFRYFDNDEYIHQELDPADIEAEIAELIRLDPNLNINKLVRDRIKEQLEFYCKLNIFPCKQLIESSTYKNYNTDNESKYMCSNCCLEQLNHTVEIAWPFHLGADNNIGIDKVQELIQYLSPTELDTVYNKKYLEHRLSCIKFNQIKMNIEAKGGDPNIFNDTSNNNIITNPNESLLVVECPTCEQTGTVGRFFRVFKKTDAELLYLHCNRCSTSFNGCDKQAPYIIDQTQFNLFQENEDICTFIERVKLLKRRQNGWARISMEKYKEIKRKEFLDNTTKQIQDDNKPYEKHCPNCKILVDNAVGCSAMTCSACRHKFCYVCCQSVDQNSHGGHDTNHFLVNMEQPLGGWFGIQCVNVHFSTQNYEQNTKNGKFNETTPIKAEFIELTNITKRKYEYLCEKYRNLGYNDQGIKERIIGQSDTWRQMDSVYFNKDRNVCYEQGDLQYDPDVLVKNELKLFLGRCDRGDEEPIVQCNTVNPEEIETLIDKENSEQLPPPPPGGAVAAAQQDAVALLPPPGGAVAAAPQDAVAAVAAVPQREPAQYVDLDIEDEDVQNIILEDLIRNNVPNNLIRNNVPNNVPNNLIRNNVPNNLQNLINNDVLIIGPEQHLNIEDNLELLQRIIAENNRNEIDLQIAIHLGQEQAQAPEEQQRAIEAQQQQAQAPEEQQAQAPEEQQRALEAPEEQQRALEAQQQAEVTLNNEIQNWFDVYCEAKITHFFIHEDFEGECNIVLVANKDYRAMIIVDHQDNEVDDNNNKKFYFAYNLKDYWDTDDLKKETEIPMSVENLNIFVTFFNNEVFKSLKIGMHGLFRDKNYLKFMKTKYNISVVDNKIISLEKLHIPQGQHAQNGGGKNKRSKPSSTFKRKNNKRKTKKHHKKSKKNHKSKKSKMNKKAKKSKRKH